MPRFAVVTGLLLILPLLAVPAVQAEETKVTVQQAEVPVSEVREPDASQKAGPAESKGQKRSPLLSGEKEKYGMASGGLVNTAIGLVVVLALIIGLAWILRRFGGLPTVGKGAVSVIGGVSLGPRERAVLLQVGEEQVLVGVAPGQVRALHVLGQKVEVPTDKTAQGFSSQLEAVMKGKRP